MKNKRKELNIAKVVNVCLIFIITIILISIVIISKVHKKSNTESSQEKEDTKYIIERILNNTKTNKNGKVIGIDISEKMSAEKLEKLLTSKNAIPTSTYSYNGVEHNTSDLAGAIYFVMIKIGARGYGEEGNLVDIEDSFVEQAKVCENIGIPYGFYYYSTALTEEETREEVEIVENNLNKISEKRYNLMDLTLDTEQCDGSRLVGKDITDIKAYWANYAEEKIGRKVMLYTGGKDVVGDKKILDLKRFSEQIKSGVPNIWFPGPRVPDGSKVYTENQEQINIIVKEVNDIEIIQTILDQNNPALGLEEHIDIDIMDLEVFENMIKSNARPSN